MSTTMVFVIVNGSLLLLFLPFVISSIKGNRETYAAIREAVKAAGGSDIRIRHKPTWGEASTVYFDVHFINDAKEEVVREVAIRTTVWGKMKEPLSWNGPLTSQHPPTMQAQLTSKEQLISDMDAEIKALRAALAASEQLDS